MQKRRTFIKTTATALAASLVLPTQLWAAKKEKVIGLQLYTLREMIKDDFEGTLEIVADIGYKTVEAAGYANRKFYGFYPKEYKNIVDGFGLKSVSTHTNFSILDAPQVIEDTLEAGCKYLIIPWLSEEKRKSIDNYKKLAEEFNKIGELCNNAGLVFGYHNHAFEFAKINGLTPYTILLENTEPDLVTMELDIYWIVWGGYNPQEYFEQFPGRFKLWHVKDMGDTSEMQMLPVGEGIINFKSIFRQKEMAGLEYAFVEQDIHSNDTPLLNIKSSFNYLENLPNY